MTQRLAIGRVARSGHPARIALTSVYLLTDLPVSIVAFVVTVVGLSLSIGLMPIFIVGLAIFWGTVEMAQWMGTFERARLRLMLDVGLPPTPRLRGWRARLTARSTWRCFGYLLLRLPLGVFTFTVMVLAWTVPLILIALPFYNGALPNGGANFGILRVDGIFTEILVVLIGVALLLLAPFIVLGLGALDIGAARALLAGQSGASMAERVGALEHSRAQVVDSAETERRRIERDLHDGAQQRLVALAINLGRAKAHRAEDPAVTRAVIEDAHAEVKQALVDLRDLARGIHPAVLTDRGLDAALSGLASRSPIPVRVDVDLARRLPPTIEAIAYFVVSEALTNIARHAHATSAAVVVRRAGEMVRIVVTDDGIGGADPARGSGLTGLAGRVAGVDGHLEIESPAGGPTTLTVELPCES